MLLNGYWCLHVWLRTVMHNLYHPGGGAATSSWSLLSTVFTTSVWKSTESHKHSSLLFTDCLMTTNMIWYLTSSTEKGSEHVMVPLIRSKRNISVCCWFIMCLSHHVSVSDRILVDKYTGREANIHIQWSWRYEIYFFVFLKKNK